MLKSADMSEALLEPDKTDIPNAPEKRRLHLSLLQLPPPSLDECCSHLTAAKQHTSSWLHRVNAKVGTSEYARITEDLV